MIIVSRPDCLSSSRWLFFVYMLDWLMRLLKMMGAVELIALAAAAVLFHDEKARSIECDVLS